MKRTLPETSTQTYIVRKNDTLTTIARRKMGTSDFSAIYEQNRDKIGNNPNFITPGMELVIPGNDTGENW